MGGSIFPTKRTSEVDFRIPMPELLKEDRNGSELAGRIRRWLFAKTMRKHESRRPRVSSSSTGATMAGNASIDRFASGLNRNGHSRLVVSRTHQES